MTTALSHWWRWSSNCAWCHTPTFTALKNTWRVRIQGKIPVGRSLRAIRLTCKNQLRNLKSHSEVTKADWIDSHNRTPGDPDRNESSGLEARQTGRRRE